MLVPLRGACDAPLHAYGLVVPPALAGDLANAAGDAQLEMRLLLECEHDPDAAKEMLRGDWGREVLRHSLAVRLAPNRTLARASRTEGDGRELLREWYEFERGRAEHAAARGAADAVGGAAARLPASQVLVAAWMRGILQRRERCGARHVAEMRATLEASSERFYATRVAWQRRVAARSCVHRCRRAAPLTLAFVGDSHVRNLFAHVATILGANVSCAKWHEHQEYNGRPLAGGAPVRLSFVWMDGIYENKDGCTYRGHYSGVTSGFPPSLPAADLYVVGAGNWEAAYCARPWQTTKTYLPPFLRWVDAHATAGARRVWLNINPRGGLNGCPSCGCRMEGGRGRSNARLLALNALAWSIAAPRGYALLDAWPIFADAFGRESLGYDGYHYTYSLKNFREKGAGKASSRERDGAPPRCTVVGVLDFIRASRLLDEHVCPAACAPQ